MHKAIPCIFLALGPQMTHERKYKLSTAHIPFNNYMAVVRPQS